MSARAWRRRSAALALPVALASGCLLVAPPEDLPAPGASGSGAQGSGGAAGGLVSQTGGTGASTPAGQGGEPNPEGGAPANGGSAGTGETGANGGRGGAGRGGAGGTRASGGAGGTVEPMGGAGQGGAAECTTNEECTARAREPSRCRGDHTCVSLRSNECPEVYGPFADPNALYIGSFAVLNKFGDNSANDVYLAEQLAVSELNAPRGTDTAGGLPGGPDGAMRPLVLIVCTNDETAAPHAVSLSMTHLVEEVQVPAIVAMLQPDQLKVALLQERDQKPFYLNPGATLHQLTDSGTTQGLAWTLLGQPSDYAPAYSLLVKGLEKQIRMERELAAGDSIKVALVTATDDFDVDLRAYVYQDLRFNNEPAADQDQYYAEYSLDPTKATIQTDIANTVGDIIDFAPDIVISTAGDVMSSSNGVLAGVESGWPSDKPRPYYLLSPYNGTSDAVGVIKDAITAAMNAETDPARRFLGVNAAPAEDLSLENSYEDRYYHAFPDAMAPEAANTDNYYDAVYYLAYAMYGADSLTGPGIAAGMKRLITGDSFNDGPVDAQMNDEISAVFSALDTKDGISLDSTLGPPDFNPDTGVRPVTPGVFCFTNEGQPAERPNTLRYDPTMNAFTGTYPCITGFSPQ